MSPEPGQHKASPEPGPAWVRAGPGRPRRVAPEDARPDEYPLSARCATCGESVLRLDPAAGWGHFAELAPELAGRLAAELGEAGLPAVLLADRLGIWKAEVRPLLRRLEAGGRAEWRAGLWYAPGNSPESS